MDEATVQTSDLAAIDLFDGLDAGRLDAWSSVTACRDVVAGEVLAEQGRPAPGLLLVLHGTVETLRLDVTGAEGVARYDGPTWMAAISLLTDTDMPVRVRTRTACRVGIVRLADFRRLVHEDPPVFERVMGRIAAVYARVSTVESTRERLTSLTTLAAGLAHELNNPAAAVQRAAAEAHATLAGIEDFGACLLDPAIAPGAVAQLSALRAEALHHAGERPAVDAVTAADGEEALLWALEDRGIADAWSLAEPLAAAGLEAGWVARVADAAGPLAGRVLASVVASLSARRLTSELQSASAQMVSLIAATKAYAYLDRDPLAKIDVHEGLEATLTVLARRLDGIAVERDYDRSAPMVAGHAPALNQVWTNLIDNAADAAGAGGRIVVATRRRAGYVLVTVADDGPGIAAEDVGRVFDPFFTTKDVGRGRGLGLTTAQRIVVGAHGGSITAESRAGSTVFAVRLPLTTYPHGPVLQELGVS
jgi:signal transduction histidine kinase